MRRFHRHRPTAAFMSVAISACGCLMIHAAAAPQSQAGHPHRATQPRGSDTFNRLGRFWGVGWSDGYHACRDGCGAPVHAAPPPAVGHWMSDRPAAAPAESSLLMPPVLMPPGGDPLRENELLERIAPPAAVAAPPLPLPEVVDPIGWRQPLQLPREPWDLSR